MLKLYNLLFIGFVFCKLVRLSLKRVSGREFERFALYFRLSSKLDSISSSILSNFAGSPPKHLQTPDPSLSNTKGITERPELSFSRKLKRY